MLLFEPAAAFTGFEFSSGLQAWSQWFYGLSIELYIVLTIALTCSAFWSHRVRRHVWCVAWRRNDFNSDRTHIAAICLHSACVLMRLPIRVRPRYENRKFDLIVVKKHDAHDARSFYANQQIVRSHLLLFWVRWRIEKNNRTILQIAVQLPYKNSSFCIGLYIKWMRPHGFKTLVRV